MQRLQSFNTAIAKSLIESCQQSAIREDKTLPVAEYLWVSDLGGFSKDIIGGQCGMPLGSGEAGLSAAGIVGGSDR